MVPTTATSPSSAQWRGPLAVAALALGSVAAVVARNPYRVGAWPACPFHAMTGGYCPLCGSTRAAFALTHGEFGLMLTSNPLLPAFVLIAAWGWLRWMSALRLVPWSIPSPWAHPSGRYLLPAVIVAFWIARNLPGLSPLAPHGHP